MPEANSAPASVPRVRRPEAPAKPPAAVPDELSQEAIEESVDRWATRWQQSRRVLNVLVEMQPGNLPPLSLTIRGANNQPETVSLEPSFLSKEDQQALLEILSRCAGQQWSKTFTALHKTVNELHDAGGEE